MVAGTALAGLSYVAALLPGEPAGWTPFTLAAGIGGLLTGLLLLGARRNGRVSPFLGWVFLGTGAWLAGGMMLLTSLPGLDAADASLVLGLPPRAAFLILGIGLVPGFVIPLAYARVFDRETLSEADLERLREAAARVAREAERVAGAREESTGPGAPEAGTDGGESPG